MGGEGERGKPKTTRDEWDGPTAGIQAAPSLKAKPPKATAPSREVTREDWDGPTAGSIKASSALRASRRPAPVSPEPRDDWDGPTAGIQAAEALRAAPRAASRGAPPVPPVGPGNPVELKPGTRLGGYEVTYEVGEGPLGKVFAAVQPSSGRRVAIRVIPPRLTRNTEVAQRFVAEVRAVNRLGHPAIADVFSFGKLSDGRFCLVMAFVDGEPLAQALERTTVLRLDEGVSVVLQLCDALGAAHAQGVVHRRLRPANVFVTPGRTPIAKLLDFGLAVLEGAAATPPGTPFYLSPEQCRGASVDRRTDVYALGIMLYEMFTGTTPFAGSSPEAVLTGHVSREPPLPSLYANLPAGLEQIILRAIRKKPEQRFGTVGELAKALRGLQADLPPVPPTIRLHR